MVSGLQFYKLKLFIYFISFILHEVKDYSLKGGWHSPSKKISTRNTNKTCALLKLKGTPEFALMVHKNNSCLKNFEALRKEKLAQTSMKNKS